MSILIDLFLSITFVLSTLVCMIEPLKFNFDLSLSLITITIIAIVFYYLIMQENKKQKRLLWIIYFILLIFTFPILFRGFVHVGNSILKAYQAHSKFTFLPIYIGGAKNPVLSCNYFIIMSAIPFIYSSVYAIINKKRFIIPFTLSLIYIGIPLLFNIEGNRIFIILYLSITTTIFMSKAIRKQFTQQNKLMTFIIFALIFASLKGVQLYYPEKTYQRDSVIEQMRINLSEKGLNYLLNVFNKNNTETSDLNSAGNRYYTGKTDLTITSEMPIDNLLKGVSFMTYENNKWINPQVDYEITTNENQCLYYLDIAIKSSYLPVPYTNQVITIQNNSTLNDVMYLPYYLDSSNYFPLDIQKGFYVEHKGQESYQLSFNNYDISKLANIEALKTTYTNYVNEHYLQVPDDTRAFLNEYLNGQVNLENSITEKIDSVTNIVENAGDYTLFPGAFPGDQDFIEYFLKENKKGYCVHFATTATMMFRTLGIPARYVEGYSLKTSNFKDGVAQVPDNQAHAWVEIYVENMGWIPLDVTPAARYSDTPVEEETPVETPNTNNNNNQNNQTNQNQTNINPEEQLIETNTSFPYVILILPLLILTYGIYRFGIKRYFNTSNDNVNVIRYYQHLSKLTINKELEQLALKARFSNHQISKEELLLASKIYRESMNQIKKKSSLLKKLWISLTYL